MAPLFVASAIKSSSQYRSRFPNRIKNKRENYISFLYMKGKIYDRIRFY